MEPPCVALDRAGGHHHSRVRTSEQRPDKARLAADCELLLTGSWVGRTSRLVRCTDGPGYRGGRRAASPSQIDAWMDCMVWSTWPAARFQGRLNRPGRTAASRTG